MNVLGSIYLIRNIKTGKVYIGQTRQCTLKRWNDHVYKALNGSSTYFHLAVRKYGKETFTIEIVESCELPLLNEREIYYIALYKSTDKRYGYNILNGGDGSPLPRVVRRKISEAKLGKSNGPCSASTKKKISMANKGKKRTETQKDNIKNSRQYGPLSKQHKSNISKSINKVKSFCLTEEETLEIHDLLERGHSDLNLSRLYGVSRKTIWRIRNGKEFNGLVYGV